MKVEEVGSSSEWSIEEDKAFENALAIHAEDASDRWEKIAGEVPGKSLQEIQLHYNLLVDDINQIEAGCVPLPSYNSSSSPHRSSIAQVSDDGAENKGTRLWNYNNESNLKASKSDQERRKGIAWTEEEHRLFLLGLEKYGKGDWRSISRNFVVTRTPTQVASHAQKYFIRLNSMNKDRRRSSIHDITSVNNGDASAAQGPITGQANSSAGNCSGNLSKQGPPTQSGAAGVGLYAPPTIGQPIGGGPMVPAFGTPVNLPPTHMAYGVQAPVHGAVVPGAPMNLGHMPPYHMPQPHTSHR